VADGAYLAAGTALTEDVEPGEIAVARGRQRNIKGWVARKRAGTKTAKAAEQALEGQALEGQALEGQADSSPVGDTGENA
jgi:bifunctional UDP-N-acetylglucosamine pyrophosphorylase/glucosamine-1-phosphate N-acetyltransferase